MSQINVFHDPGELPHDWHVWIDTEGCEKDGTCIGVGNTRALALRDAKKELRKRLADISWQQSVYQTIAES